MRARLREWATRFAAAASDLLAGMLRRTWAVFVVAAKRLLSQRWLALATALGLVVAVALTVSIPLYADAVYYRILTERLYGETVAGRKAHPPFAFMFRYVGAWKGPVDWEDVRPVDEYLSGRGAADLGLPLQLQVRYFATADFRLFPQEDVAYADVREPLAWVSFAVLDDLQNHIRLEGAFPAVADPSSDSVVEVLISDPFALQLGLQVGEEYVVFARQTVEGRQRTTQIPIRIAGVWTPLDTGEPYWFYNQDAFETVLFIPEQSFVGRIDPHLEQAVNLGVWYLVMDGTDVYADKTAELLSHIARVEQQVTALLPYTRLDVSPKEDLYSYQRSVGLLTVLLYAFSIPIIGLILAFIGLVVGLSVGRQRGEIAVLRSRGATALQVLGIAALEGLLVGVVALIVGVVLGVGVAHIIGRARSFLDFSLQADLRVGITATTIRYGLIAVGLALIAQIIPTIGAARHTIVTYKQERARALRRPWWQRAWLDVLLLIPAAYGAYLLKQQGSVVADLGSGDPFQNPLLFLVPALGILALTLFILRILPTIIAVIAWISSHVGGVGTLLATRYLSRTPGFYTAPLILLILTLSLSTFTASLAQTLDSHLSDQKHYLVGADMRLVELGEDTQSDAPAGFATMATDYDEEGPRWLFLPVTEYLEVDGVQAATRVGRYSAVAQLGGGSLEGVFLGVDWLEFADVAFWRDDFAAPESLGALRNALGAVNEGVLVPRDLLRQNALNIGDTIRVGVATSRRVELDLKIVGAFDLFPTWYPVTAEGEYEPLFVGNLSYLFEQAGEQVPYHVWLKMEEGVGCEEVMEGAREVHLNVLSCDAVPVMIAETQERPERQGLFGALSVGFLAAALLTVLGFLLYAFFSFRRRFIELGILRAVGLSAGQMTAFLAWELIFLILTGALAGTGLGVWASRLFIPALQIGGGLEAQTPPYVVQIAWSAIFRIYILFGALFVAALGGLAALLLRMKVFQAVKLGETT